MIIKHTLKAPVGGIGKAKFEWSEDCRRSFKKLKKLFSLELVMMNYDPARETRLYVDHGPNGVAASVCEAYSEPGQAKQWRMVTHKSRSLKKAEQNQNVLLINTEIWPQQQNISCT